MRSLGMGMAMSGAASAVALGGLAVFWREPLTLAGVLAAGAGLYGAFRGYGSFTRRFEDLDALHQFTSAVDGAADTDALLEVTLSQTRNLFSARFAEVVLLRGVESIVTSSAGAVPPQRRPAPPALVEALADEIDPARLVTMLDEAPGVIANHYRSRGVNDAMVARMQGDGDAAAMIVVGAPNRSRFDKDDLRLFGTMARQARVAFERGRLVDRLRREMTNKEHQALHDALTGLPNRLHFTIVVEESLRRARESGTRVAVLLIDLDRFKEVNDTLGHERGDVLLQELALRLSEAVGDDHMARLGGDEFGIVCSRCGIAEVSGGLRIGAILQRPFNEGLAIQVTGASASLWRRTTWTGHRCAATFAV
jgi:GGDEF domain-containing protein